MSDVATDVVRLVLGALCSQRSERTLDDVVQTTGLSLEAVDEAVGELVRREFLLSALEPLSPTDAGRKYYADPDTDSWEIEVLTLVRDAPGKQGTWYGTQIGWGKETHRGRWQKLRLAGLIGKNGTGSASRWHLTSEGHAVLQRHQQELNAERDPRGPLDGFHASSATAEQCRDAIVGWLCMQDDGWTTEGPLADWMIQHGWLQSSVHTDLGELVRRGRIEVRKCGARRWYREAGRGDLGEALLKTNMSIEKLRSDLENYHNAVFA